MYRRGRKEGRQKKRQTWVCMAKEGREEGRKKRERPGLVWHRVSPRVSP